ncbi:hypothetical protein HYALB_00012936 [Hymenoscyphus albidus]|uniref:FAD linked oxidase N-terminal domain-containing protein n=1 Tax=Hymenoscyphus albidus TaxID=595503 RepID=A0A9N9LU16_9HELO|nr:hypothetical protein HYALB_00012936 [Hymenoscyphus albidus]
MGMIRLRFGLSLLLYLGRHVYAQSDREAQGFIGENDSVDNCFNAYKELSDVLGTKAYHGNLPRSFAKSYHCSRQGEVIPACVVRPITANDVSTTIQIVRKYQCHFAVKSGGHAMFKGASNAEGGVTIDMIKVNNDRKTVAREIDGERFMKFWNRWV